MGELERRIRKKSEIVTSMHTRIPVVLCDEMLYLIEEARKSFPLLHQNGKEFLDEDLTLEWFKKWFGKEKKAKNLAKGTPKRDGSGKGAS